MRRPIEGHDEEALHVDVVQRRRPRDRPAVIERATPLLVRLPRVDAFDDIVAGAVAGFAGVRLRRGGPRRERQEG